jgi:hypothetical protein
VIFEKKIADVAQLARAIPIVIGMGREEEQKGFK